MVSELQKLEVVCLGLATLRALTAHKGVPRVSMTYFNIQTWRGHILYTVFINREYIGLFLALSSDMAQNGLLPCTQ